MKAPPLLLGAALVFWGWQTDFLLAGVVMALVLEGALLIKARWEVTDDDFTRVWTFCTVAFLAAMVYAFTENDGLASVGGLFQEANLAAQNRVGVSSSRTAISMIRWLPMVFFLFIAAQVYGTREKIPLANISWFMRRRRRQALKLGEVLPEPRSLNISFPYFAGCLFAASAHIGGTSYFWGLGVLLMWALWSQRSRRFGIATWAGTLCLAAAFGYFGQFGIGQLARLAESLNAQWLNRAAGRGFDPNHSWTEIGQIGRIKTSGKIVIRLEPKRGEPAPPYLREASFREYANTVWHAGKTKEEFQDINSETNSTTWILQPGRTNSATVSIATYLDQGKALLPLPTGSTRLEKLPAFRVAGNSLGAVQAEGPGLLIFDALWGSRATRDSPPSTNDYEVPVNETNALQSVMAELKPAGTSDKDKLEAVRRFFLANFTYSLWQKADLKTRVVVQHVNSGTNMVELTALPVVVSPVETPLARFLLRTHSGHCEFFATATVLLLRELNIPARYAVGYSVHEGAGEKYVVRERDAHAWCLVWNDVTKAWEDFDTTPGSWIAAEGQRASAWQFVSDTWSWLWFQFSKFRWGQTHLRQYILWGLVPVLAVLLYQVIARRGRRQNVKGRTAEPDSVWPGLDSEFYRLEAQLARRGVIRQPSEPLTTWLARAAADPSLRDADGLLQKLLRLHYRYRFDPQGLSASDREALRREAAVWLERMAAAAAKS